MSANPFLVQKRIAAVALVLLLCGCSLAREIHGGQEIDNWAQDNEQLAQAGKIKWSVFYAQYLDKVAATPTADQAAVMERLGILETAALFYEQGRIDRSGFDAVRGYTKTYGTIDDAAANNFARQALVQALQKKEAAAAQAGTR